ncbi:sortase domain-containing protein [Nocardioides endophyticus]
MRLALTAVAAALAVAFAGAPTEPASARPATGHPTAPATHVAKPAEFSSGKPRNARLTIPAVGIRSLKVVAYRGKTDDAPGTRIQNRGIAASSHGPRGGTGPGGLGNYQVTAHRTSHGGVFRRTPSLHRGDRLLVDVGRWRYVYRVVTTRWVSFRSAKSLREQRAAVPGRPGVKPKKGYITISTCATPEDHARGNYWTDRFGNPEHRIDKIGVLVRRMPSPHVHQRH